MQRLWRMDMNMEQWWDDRDSTWLEIVSGATSPPQMELERHRPETYSLNRAGTRLIEWRKVNKYRWVNSCYLWADLLYHSTVFRYLPILSSLDLKYSLCWINCRQIVYETSRIPLLIKIKRSLQSLRVFQAITLLSGSSPSEYQTEYKSAFVTLPLQSRTNSNVILGRRQSVTRLRKLSECHVASEGVTVSRGFERRHSVTRLRKASQCYAAS